MKSVIFVLKVLSFNKSKIDDLSEYKTQKSGTTQVGNSTVERSCYDCYNNLMLIQSDVTTIRISH